MAKGRMISCALSTSRRFAALFVVTPGLAEFAQSLYPLIVVHTDDFGRMSGDAWSVKFQAHPASPRTLEEFEIALKALESVGLIERYDGDNGDKCLAITQFDGHQSGLHKRTRSRFPEPPGNSGKFREIPSEQNRTEQKGKEENGRPLSLVQPIKAKTMTVEECFGPSEDPNPSPEADAVGRVADLWTKEFADAHNGATSMPASQKDYDAMRYLAKAYPDLGHLAKMLRFFFRASDLPDWAMLKTPPAFVRMAPLTDEKVRTSR